jgi:hypothetical protein
MAVEQLPVVDGVATGTHAYAANETFTITVTGDTTGKIATATAAIDQTPLVLDITANESNPLRCEIWVSNIPDAETGLTGYWGDDYQGHAAITAEPMRVAHNYAAPGVYEVTIVGDVTAVTGTGEFVAASPELAVTQVEYLDVSAAITGMPGDTSVTVDWGDGTTAETVTLTDGAATATHTYGDQSGNPYTVTVTGDTTATAVTDTVTVTNTEMVVTADTSADPTVTITATDIPGSNTQVEIDWGDGTEPETADVTDYTATATHTYVTNGNYKINLLAPETNNLGERPVTITGGAPAPLPAPTGVGLDTSADPPTDSSFSVQWDAVAGATGYTATATGGSQMDWPGTIDDSGDPVRASFASLEAATEYTVTVTALGDGTTNADSAPATGTVTTGAAA